MSDKRICIYTSEPDEDLVNEIMAENPDMGSDQAFLQACDEIEEDRVYMCQSFFDIKGNFVIYGSTGSWDGRRGGFTPYMHTTLSDAMLELTSCLKNTESHVYVYVTEDGEITAHKAHHDGTNYYTLRQLPDDFDEELFDEIASLPDGSGKYFDEHAEKCGRYIIDRWNLEFQEEND